MSFGLVGSIESKLSEQDVFRFIDEMRRVLGNSSREEYVRFYLKAFLRQAGFNEVDRVNWGSVSDTLDGAKPSDPTRSTTDPFEGSPFVALGKDGKLLRLPSGWLSLLIKAVRKIDAENPATGVLLAARDILDYAGNAARRARPLTLGDGSMLEWPHPWQEGVSLGVAGRNERLIEWDTYLRDPVIGRHTSCGGGFHLVGNTMLCDRCQYSIELHNHPRTPEEVSRAFA